VGKANKIHRGHPKLAEISKWIAGKLSAIGDASAWPSIKASKSNKKGGEGGCFLASERKSRGRA